MASRRSRAAWLASALALGSAAVATVATTGMARAAEPAAAADNPYNDPEPIHATAGIADCAPPRRRVLTPDQARHEAHQRVERGTSCWLAGQCEPGGDYKYDGETNARVAAAIAQDARFADTSLWVETLRGFVTIEGCLAEAAQGPALEALVKRVERVKLVWQEAKPRTAR